MKNLVGALGTPEIGGYHDSVDDGYAKARALMHAIMSGIAEFYSRNLAQEVIKGLSQKVKSGGTIGRVPPGYLNVTHRIDGREVRTVAELLHTLLRQDLEHLRSGAEHSKRIASRRLQKLGGQRQKLLDAYYADSMPMDLFKSEQDRITKQIERSETELARADLTFEKIAKTLARCLQFAQHCDQLYRDAPPKLRRRLNQAFFEKLYVHENGEVEAHLAEPFDLLLRPDLVVETEEQAEALPSESPESTEPSDLDLLHRDRDWADGAPAWLRDGQWWDRISQWRRAEHNNRPRRTPTCQARVRRPV